MNREITTVAILGLCSFLAHAGNMGPVTVDTSMIPYLGLEASYTWNAINGFSINNIDPLLGKNGWGGRVSAGVNRPYTEKFTLNAELGGGYYGVTTVDIAASGVGTRINITGYDFLVGGTYRTSYLDLFGNFGFMAQNLQSTLYRNYAKRFTGNMMSGLSKNSGTQAAILPEIKAGVSRDIGHHFTMTLSYLYVFGSTVSGNIYSSAINTPSSSIQISGDLNEQSPSLSTVLFGLRYNFD